MEQEMSKHILVTDWEQVDEDDFYLTNEWDLFKDMEEVDKEELKNRVKNGNIYLAYTVGATSYAIYRQMDAFQVFIDRDLNIVLECESAIIGNNHEKRIEHDY